MHTIAVIVSRNTFECYGVQPWWRVTTALKVLCTVFNIRRAFKILTESSERTYKPKLPHCILLITAHRPYCNFCADAAKVDRAQSMQGANMPYPTLLVLFAYAFPDSQIVICVFILLLLVTTIALLISQTSAVRNIARMCLPVSDWTWKRFCIDQRSPS